MIGLAHTLVRIFGVVRKELIELAKQPGLLTILVIGPLVILLLFGAGVSTRDPAVKTIFVSPPGEPEILEIVEHYADTQSRRLSIVAVSTDKDDALAGLEDGRANMVIIIPPHPQESMKENKRVTMEVYHTLLDPIEQQAILLFARGATNDLNTILLTDLIDKTQGEARFMMDAVDQYRNILTAAGVISRETDLAGIDNITEQVREFTEIKPSIVASPLRQKTESIAGILSAPVFYSPAVIALIIQHLTMTFMALSIVREKELGTTELFAVSPLRSWEQNLGKILAYFLSGGAIGTLLLAGIVYGLDVPTKGGVLPVLGIIALELLASMGIGFLLGHISKNITQVVQASMLILLASVFFGGLVLSEERFQPWLKPISYLLPTRHALTAFRDSMMRGFAPDPQAISILVITGIVSIALGMFLSSISKVGSTSN